MDGLLWLRIWDLASTGVSQPEQSTAVCRAIVAAMSADAGPGGPPATGPTPNPTDL